MSEPLWAAASHAFADELDAALGRIRHCVGQLADEQVWVRSRPDMHAVGNLLLHLTGNVKQMIVGAVGGEPDTRDRPAEFAEHGPVPKEQLLSRLADVVGRAKLAIANADPEDLGRVRLVNVFNLTGWQSIVRSVAHFRGHTQEIIHMTRDLLGDRYQFAGPR